MALVAGGTLNSSAANFNTAVNGVVSGTLNLYDRANKIYIFLLNLRKCVEKGNTYTLNGNFGSEVNVILNVTFGALSMK